MLSNDDMLLEYASAHLIHSQASFVVGADPKSTDHLRIAVLISVPGRRMGLSAGPQYPSGW